MLAACAVAVLGAAAGAVAVSLHPAPATSAADHSAARLTPVRNALGETLANGVATAMNQLPDTKITTGPAASTTTPRAKKPARTTGTARSQQRAVATAVYRNPLRAITGLLPERIDMGVDFGGTGPIFAIGDGVVTNATGSSPGWPGGGWITYQLTDGPAKGLVVYVAEDVTPTVSVGATVTPDTQVATMYNGGAGIETGWAMPDGASAESQLPQAGGISGGGPFPTEVGVSFETLLQALGVPAAENAGQHGYGVLPAGYLTTWTGLTTS